MTFSIYGNNQHHFLIKCTFDLSIYNIKQKGCKFTVKIWMWCLNSSSCTHRFCTAPHLHTSSQRYFFFCKMPHKNNRPYVLCTSLGQYPAIFQLEFAISVSISGYVIWRESGGNHGNTYWNLTTNKLSMLMWGLLHLLKQLKYSNGLRARIMLRSTLVSTLHVS